MEPVNRPLRGDSASIALSGVTKGFELLEEQAAGVIGAPFWEGVGAVAEDALEGAPEGGAARRVLFSEVHELARVSLKVIKLFSAAGDVVPAVAIVGEGEAKLRSPPTQPSFFTVN